jgi:hypothetical protein
MKKYKFILKPLLFICNLLFATWLVFAIEDIKPTDFGRYEYLFEDAPALKTKKLRKEHLIRICSEYRKGIIDTTELVRKIDMYLALPEDSISLTTNH